MILHSKILAAAKVLQFLVAWSGMCSVDPWAMKYISVHDFFCKDVHPNGIHVLYHWQTLGQPYLRSPLQCHSPIWASTCFRCSNQFTMLVLHTMFVAMCLHETALTISQVTMDPQGGKMLIMAPIPTGSKDMIPIFGNHVWWARMHPWPWQRVAQKEVLKRCACQLKEVLAIHIRALRHDS